jgi:hypothetical protein
MSIRMFEKQSKQETSKEYVTSSLLRSYAAYSWTLKLEAEGPMKWSVEFYRIAYSFIPEDCTVHQTE